MVVNPGRLCKRNAGGTFMRLLIDPIQEADSIMSKFKAEIVRI